MSPLTHSALSAVQAARVGQTLPSNAHSVSIIRDSARALSSVMRALLSCAGLTREEAGS